MYIDIIIKSFGMENSIKGFIWIRRGVKILKEVLAKTPRHRMSMEKILYASTMDPSCMLMLCLKPTVTFASSVICRFQVDSNEKQ